MQAERRRARRRSCSRCADTSGVSTLSRRRRDCVVIVCESPCLRADDRLQVVPALCCLLEPIRVAIRTRRIGHAEPHHRERHRAGLRADPIAATSSSTSASVASRSTTSHVQLALDLPNEREPARYARSASSAADLRRDRRRRTLTSHRGGRSVSVTPAAVYRGRGWSSSRRSSCSTSSAGTTSTPTTRCSVPTGRWAARPQRGLPRPSAARGARAAEPGRSVRGDRRRRSTRSRRDRGALHHAGRTARCTSCSGTASRSRFASRTAARRPSG